MSDGYWTDADQDKAKNKQEVTIQQLKEILQPMETKFTPIAMKCTQEQFEAIKPKLDKLKSLRIFMFNKEWKIFYLGLFKDGSITNGLIPSSGSEKHEEWNEEIFLKSCGIEVDTLEQQLEKAKAEVKRIEDEIEESKIKVGDFIYSYVAEAFFFIKNEEVIKTHKQFNTKIKKITDQELINKLNNLIK